MSKTLWGRVYFKDVYAGLLEEKAGGRTLFTYDPSYLESGEPPIAFSLPLRVDSFISERGLPPFFDNLVAEGWLMKAQARSLGVLPENRFALLLGFGHDLAGAVSIIDPEPQQHNPLEHADKATRATLMGQASLSGIQRKLLVIKEGDKFRPVSGKQELSTHIAKLASGNLSELLELEYFTTEAMRALLPDDEVVEMELTSLSSIKEDALIIPRFDRTPNRKRIHFEEFNQLLGHYSENKYEGSYEEMGHFILKTAGCMPAEADKLLRRVLACFLVGNTDAHFKNFAMLHARDGLRLTPAYDLVASSVYKDYQTLALNVGGVKNLALGKLKPKHFVKMGKSFGATDEAILSIVETFKKRLPDALTAIEKAQVGSKGLQKQLQEKMEKRWKGNFSLTGLYLSKKRG